MFRNRRNSQKPSDDFIANFKASFQGVAGSAAGRQHAASAQQAGPSLTEALDVAQLHPRPHQFGDHEDIKQDGEPTPRGNADQWRFTPSLLDPNSFAFSAFANQPPGYYTPTPGGTNTIYHNQAGDLHTPGFSMGLGTPLSMPNTEGALQAAQTSNGAHMHGFPSATLPPHHFQNLNPFAAHQQQGFAPHQFQHHPPPTFDPHLAQHVEEPHSMDGMHVDMDMQEQSPLMNFSHQSFHDPTRNAQPTQPLENFRFHVTLNAPTAMIKQADEIPVTYLNKGQAYAITIVDTLPGQVLPTPNKYRTFIRISFEDEVQRAKPSACWSLWKEGRGTNEAHQRGGRLQAVEFVESTQVGGIEVAGRPHVELESASFDGFVVAWTPAPNQPAECSVAVRFNFLSTDFSHSKGVKGIPVRLCAKTDIVNTIAPQPTSIEPPKPEVCYCKVKLFRDHGAERKLSNDIQHVKKTIDKLKQQIAQVESGMKDFGKRKRGNSMAKVASDKPGKVSKHKRTWSLSSDGGGGQRTSGEDNLHVRLATLQDMFTSTRPASVLYLRGEETDDPELHPVSLTGEPQDLTKIDTSVEPIWEKQSAAEGSSMVSPTPSSTQSPGGRRESGFTQPTPFTSASRMSSNEWRNMPGQTVTGEVMPTSNPQMSPPNVPLKIQKLRSSAHASPAGWVEAVDVDQTYQPPPERAVKPIACFYVQPRIVGEPSGDSYYRAVYLMQRTLKDMVNGIASKCNIEPTQVVRTLRVRKGMQIKLGDEDVRELPEGQDMTAEFQQLAEQSPPRREWDAGASDLQVDGDVTTIENVTTTGYELKLYY